MYKILVVEDSEDYQKIITRTLGDHQVFISTSAEEAAIALKNANYDMILIDINLPQKDGYSLLSEMRGRPELCDTPIVCLTGRTEITDKVTAFSLGADDYITKPFDPIELQIRVESRLKKTFRKKNEDLITHVGAIEIDHARHRVTSLIDNIKTEIDVTQTEFKLLSCLARRPEQVYTRGQLLIATWGEDAEVLDRVVDAHICLLRKKLGPHSHYIKAVTGIGYKLVPYMKKKITS